MTDADKQLIADVRTSPRYGIAGTDARLARLCSLAERLDAELSAPCAGCEVADRFEAALELIVDGSAPVAVAQEALAVNQERRPSTELTRLRQVACEAATAIVALRAWLDSDAVRRVSLNAHVHGAGITPDEFGAQGQPAFEAADLTLTHLAACGIVPEKE